MRRLLLVLLLLCPFAAHALTDAPCVFRSFWTPMGTGTELVSGSEAPVSPGGVEVSWWAWFCPTATGWDWYVVRCIQGRTCLTAATVSKELDTAARSADKLAALRAAMTKYQTPVLPAEQADWDFALAAARSALEKTLPATPPVIGDVYVVTGAQAFVLKADGTRSTSPYPTAPTKGATCDCTTKLVQYGATFCKVPNLSTAQTTVVAGCSLKR
jgi:hypothetical protein